MDNQEYLKQISQTVRPEKKSMGFLSSPIFKVAVGGIAALILIIIFGSILGGGKNGLKDQTIGLKLHVENTLSVISSYQPNLKSSDLRSSSASLSSVLSNTNRELTDYVREKYSYGEEEDKKKKDDEKVDKVKEEADLHKDELAAELFNAKISGILDRIFAHEMALEISLITTEESSLYDATSDESLRSILESSYNSLNTLYANFNDFSETK